MTKLNFHGNIFGQSGYAVHSKELMNALIEAGIEVAYCGARIEGCERLLNDDELKAFKTEPFVNENILAVQMPQEWAYLLAEPHKKFLGYVVWEGTKVPKTWLQIFKDERVDYLLVPSNHTKQAILNTMKDQTLIEATKSLDIIKKIIIVPHGVNHDIFKSQERIDDGAFTFVTNGGWAHGLKDRKGIQWLIKAFNEEFLQEEPVQLFVHINTAYCPPGWDLNNELNKLELKDGRGRLIINTDNISFDKLSGLYNIGDVYVSATMGEAFGLPILEAMTCGKPVIVTGFGGQTDFVNEENGWLIDYILEENDWDWSYEGVSWAKPSLNRLKRLLREAYNNRDLVKKKGLKALETAQDYSWDKSAGLVVNLLG